MIWIEWFKPQHAEEVEATFRDSFEILRRSQLLQASLNEWLRQTIAREENCETPNQEWCRVEESRWWASQSKAPPAKEKEIRLAYLESKFLSQEILDEKIKIQVSCKEWAKKIWGSSLSQLFLDQKDLFDEVNFKMMRLPNNRKNLANEIYHRLKANEAKFDNLAMEYGHGPERMPGGCNNKLTLDKPQAQLSARLKRLSPGELSKPFVIAEWILLVKMVSSRPATLDEHISEALLQRALDKFLHFGATRLAEAMCDGRLVSNSLKTIE